MRIRRLLPLCAAAALACESAVVENQPVVVTLRMQLARGLNVGPTPGRVYAYTDSGVISRAAAFPEFGEACVLATTPVTTCTFEVPWGSTVSLIAAEPDPAVSVRFAAESPQDTVRDGRYVEFTGWTDCEDRAERGLCVIHPRNNTTIEANFQLLQQVVVYQVGAARVDYLAYTAGPTLKVPAVNDNILDYAGCRRLVISPDALPCDSVRVVGDVPHHRISAYVGRKTIFGMFTRPGLETELQDWQGPCIQSGIYGPGVCSLIVPDTSGAPIRITVRYSWWECPAGVSERDTGGCVLRRP